MKAKLDAALKKHGAKIPVPDPDYDGGPIRSEPPGRG